jgi:hypothetical protein
VNASNVCTFALSKTCRVAKDEGMCCTFALWLAKTHHVKRIHFPIVSPAEPLPALGSIVDASPVVTSVVVVVSLLRFQNDFVVTI